MLIDSRTRSVEVFRRHPEGWVLQPVPDDGRLELLSLGFGCGLDAIYEDVALDGADRGQGPGGAGLASGPDADCPVRIPCRWLATRSFLRLDCKPFKV